MKKNTLKTCTQNSISIPKIWLEKQEKSRVFAIPMRGNGMINPADPAQSIWSGDLLIVDPDETVTNGDVALVSICGEFLMARRWYNLNDDEIKLVADNPTVKTLIKRKKEVEIVGKVTAFGHSLEKRKSQKRNV